MNTTTATVILMEVPADWRDQAVNEYENPNHLSGLAEAISQISKQA